MKILGISAFYHDAAAAIIEDGNIIAAAQEERFTREKHDASFPINAIKYCLDYTGCNIDDLAAIVFYDKPLLKFERLLETFYSYAPQGWARFIQAIPIWSKEKLFLKKIIREALKALAPSPSKGIPNILFSEHHLAHAASAFYPSPFKEAVILTIDGVGEWATASICRGNDKKIQILKELRFPHSVGLFYSAFTYFLGFRVNSGEYKLMGLAPYGNPTGKQTQAFVELIKSHLVDIKPDGSIYLNQQYFTYSTKDRMLDDQQWEKLFGFPKRAAADQFEQHHANLAIAIQMVTEEIVLKMAKEAKELTGVNALCLAGGVALNCVANGKLLAEGLFEHLYIQPAAGDAGGAIGAALSAYHMHFDQKRIISKPDGMSGAYLGPEYSYLEIEKLARKYDAPFHRYDDFDALAKVTATLLNQGQVIGWFQGRMEFGPRALGNRSILGDPRSPEMQRHMNLKIKFRESFRPFAPSVLAEDADQYFDLSIPSPYMLLVRQIQDQLKKTVPADYNEYPVHDKLYVERSNIPAVTHVDFTARIQTVHKETNPRFHALLSHFKVQTGLGMLINTSFNVRGEPIVCSPDDAYQCFLRTDMDTLVLGDYLFKKDEQHNMTALEAVLEKGFALD
ncbi:MAG: carbamoyltransferase [Saprospiraceae bacterium]